MGRFQGVGEAKLDRSGYPALKMNDIEDDCAHINIYLLAFTFRIAKSFKAAILIRLWSSGLYNCSCPVEHTVNPLCIQEVQLFKKSIL